MTKANKKQVGAEGKLCNMDEISILNGETLRRYWGDEVRALKDKIKAFEYLIPKSKSSKDGQKKKKSGSDHNLKDGEYVESLLRETLQKYLPKRLEVLSGFIVRPAVKTGKAGRARKGKEDEHSTQLDIIVYDSLNFPILHQAEGTSIVVPEGVVGIISVKKSLEYGYIQDEIEKLRTAATLCRSSQGKVRGPFLALIGMQPSKSWSCSLESRWKEIQSAYQEEKVKKDLYFDDTVGYVGVLDQWGIFKTQPEGINPREAKYIDFEFEADEAHLGLQFLLSGILSVLYDESRNTISRPGFTAFPFKVPSGFINIKVKGLRRKWHQTSKEK